MLKRYPSEEFSSEEKWGLFSHDANMHAFLYMVRLFDNNKNSILYALILEFHIVFEFESERSIFLRSNKKEAVIIIILLI